MAVIKRPFGDIKSLSTPKDIGMLNAQIRLLFAAANFSSSTPAGGGGGGGSGGTWTTATRPAHPLLGAAGFNLDFQGEETYTAYGWVIKFGFWVTSARPSVNIAPGTRGWNLTLGAKEYWTGHRWQQD